MEKRISITDLKAMKKRGDKIVMLTAYDYPSARLVEEAGVPLILVGDSLGMVVQWEQAEAGMPGARSQAGAIAEVILEAIEKG